VWADTYRRLGADLPYGDPLRAHGVAMEGWFWRLSAPASGDVVVVLAAVNRDAAGAPWGTVGVAAHPGGFSRAEVVARASASADGRTLRIGGVEAGAADGAGGGARRFARPEAWLEATPERLAAEVPGGSVDVELLRPGRWPRRAFGGLGAAQAIPGLSQYWHPWLLRAEVRGRAVIGGREIALDGAVAYAEKNWSNGGFPERWWWGQAHAFDSDPAACVAFAGGLAGLGPLRLTATSLVVSAGGEMVRLVRPLQPLHVDVGTGGWRLSGRTAGGVAVEVEGHANGTPPHLLPIPVPGERRHAEAAASQHLAGALTLRVRRRGRTLFSGTSLLAGLEQGTSR
jgi:tocopherol cyclase